MEATGRDGGSGPWSWINRYRREQTGSSSFIISSSSGTSTTVSTTYTSSAASGLSSVSSMEDEFCCRVIGGGRKVTRSILTFKGFDLPQFPPNPIDPLQNNKTHLKEARKEGKMEQMVQEFFAASSSSSSSSANCSCSGDDMRVLERWFTELGVAWVLQISAAEGASAGRMLKRTFDSKSWIRALIEIKESIRLTTSLSPVLEEEPAEATDTEGGKQPSTRPDQFQIAQFFQQTTLKMLAFVDVAVNEVLLGTNVVPELYGKLNTLLYVHTALSNALLEFRVPLHSSPSVEAERIESEMASLLSAKEDKAHEAIWNTLVGIWDCLLESMDDSSGTQTPQASPDIHILTHSVMAHITFLLDNFSTAAAIVSETARLGKYVPYTGGELPLDSVIMGMMDRLEEKLVNISKSFTDRGLGFLFLLNNTWYIRERLGYKKQSNLTLKVSYLAGKIEGYKESYLEVSWAPSLSCLLNPSLLRFWKRYFPLSRFESEFRKTYTIQKLWKVPCAKLRKSLREAVTKKIIPCYKNYIDGNKVTTLEFTHQELEEMLKELFEG